jgi:chromosome segregation ATPase
MPPNRIDTSVDDRRDCLLGRQEILLKPTQMRITNMAKLDEKLAKLEEQMADYQERMTAIKARKAEVLAQKRQEQKRKHDRAMLLLGRVIEHRLQSESSAEKRNAELASIRAEVSNTFPETNERDRNNILSYLDHLTETLQPLSQETLDSEPVTSSSVPQATPVAASIPGQDGLAGANRGISGA